MGRETGMNCYLPLFLISSLARKITYLLLPLHQVAKEVHSALILWRKVDLIYSQGLRGDYCWQLTLDSKDSINVVLRLGVG
jgi:hypothetical protein